MLSLIMHFFIKELDLKAPRDNRKIMIVILEKYLDVYKRQVELCSQRTPVVTEVSKGHKVQCLIAEGLVKFRENWEEENE